MPTRRLPNSTPAILRLLKTAHDAYVNTPSAADRAITADQFAQLDLTVTPPSLYKRFATEASEVETALAQQAPLTSALSQKAAALTMFVSHFHQALDNAIARGYFALGARSYYGRDLTATAIPDLSTYAAVEEAAQKIVDGEAARQTAEGSAFKPMALPSAAEVAAQLAAFKSAKTASDQAQTKTDDEREDVTALYPAAQEFAVDLCDQIEFFYRKDKVPGSFRTKCQRWGVVYFYEAGETPEPMPVVTPTPAPPTP
jgi:hypothetical protein